MGTETTQQVYENAAGLLARMGYIARAKPDFRPPGSRNTVLAIVTDAPAIVVGYAVTIVAEEPEAHLPQAGQPAGRLPAGMAGGPLIGWYSDNNE